MQAGTIAAPAEIKVKLVDTDVHPALRAPDELAPYMPEPWRTREFGRRGVGGRSAALILSHPERGFRLETYPEGGGTPGSDPELARRQLLEAMHVDYAVMIPLVGRPQADPEHEAAVCAAVNDWQADTWLGKYNAGRRYWGSLRIAASDPALAAKEIERWAGHPAFIQVMIPPNVQPQLGHPQYDPIYEAADRHGLAIMLHSIKAPGMGLMTPVGFPSYYVEYHPQLAMAQMAHLTSMIFEGVFERFPGLRVASVEGGVGWFGPLFWRLDNLWRELGSDVPQVRRPPSAYLADNIRMTTQPWEEAPSAKQLSQLISWIDVDRLLMFATDYPHHDADDPQWMIPRLPKGSRDKVLADNAIEFYRLPATRPAGEGDEHDGD